MANELVIHYPTGSTLNVYLSNEIGQIYNGSTFEEPASANWATYDIPMSEAATATGIYRASVPAVAAGAYGWVVRKQAGGSTAVSDIVVGVGSIRWTGTAEEAVPAAVNVTMWKGSAPDDLSSGKVPATNPTGGTITTVTNPVTVVSSSGAISFPVTVNDEDENPIDDVEIWISTDSAGTNVVAGTTLTDALGVATFMLDAGTYYLWRQRSGYNFVNPVTIVVS